MTVLIQRYIGCATEAKGMDGSLGGRSCGSVSTEYTERVLTFRYVLRLASTSLALNRERELRETDTIEERGSAIEILNAPGSAFDNDPISVRIRRQPR